MRTALVSAIKLEVISKGRENKERMPDLSGSEKTKNSITTIRDIKGGGNFAGLNLNTLG